MGKINYNRFESLHAAESIRLVNLTQVFSICLVYKVTSTAHWTQYKY